MKKICLLLVVVLSVFMLTGCGEHNSSPQDIKEINRILVNNDKIPRDLEQVDKVEYYIYEQEHGSTYYYYVYKDKNDDLYMLDYRTYKDDNNKKYYIVTLWKNVYVNDEIELLDEYNGNPDGGRYTYSDEKISIKNKYESSNQYEFEIKNGEVIQK